MSKIIRRSIGLFILPLMLLFQNFINTNANAESPVEGYDIIVVAGQSNAVGFGTSGEADSSEFDDYVSKIYQVTRPINTASELVIAEATEPLHNWNTFETTDSKGEIIKGRNLKSRGFGMAFAKRYARYELASNRRILIIPAAKSGSSIMMWDKEIEYNEADLYSDMQNRINFALNYEGKDNRLVAFHWQQGEADINIANSNSTAEREITKKKLMPGADVYKSRLINLIQNLRHDFRDQGLFPIIIGEPSRLIPGIYKFQQAFVEVMKQMPTMFENIAFVSSNDLPVNCNRFTTPVECDYVHFSQEGQWKLGQRRFEAFQQINSKNKLQLNYPDLAGQMLKTRNENAKIIYLADKTYDAESNNSITLQNCSKENLADNSRFFTRLVSTLASDTVVIFPKGKYCISSINIPGNLSGITFLGSGVGEDRTELIHLNAIENSSLFRTGQIVNSVTPGAVSNLTVQNFKVSSSDPSSKSVLFLLEKCTNCLVSKIEAKNINAFAKVQDTNNMTFEEISISNARTIDSVFNLAPIDSSSNLKLDIEANMMLKSDVVSFFFVKGKRLSESGSWVNLGNVHSLNFHEVSFQGGGYGLKAENRVNSFRYISGQGLRLIGQATDGIRLESGSGVQLDRSAIINCGGTGISLLPGFLGSSQIHNTEIHKCATAGIHVRGFTDSKRKIQYINFINNIVTGDNTEKGIKIEGPIGGLNILDSVVFGPIVPIEKEVCTDCTDIKVVGMGFGKKQSLAWKYNTQYHNQGLVEIMNRTRYSFNELQQTVLAIGGVDKLQEKIDSLCDQKGGTIILSGRFVITKQLVIEKRCKPIKLMGVVRSINPSIIFNYTRSGDGLVMKGSNHSIENLSFASISKNAKIENIISIIGASNIGIFKNNFRNADRAIKVQRSNQIYMYYNRYANLNVEGVLLDAQEDPIAKIRMAMETSLCSWEEESNDVNHTECETYTALHIKGAVSDVIGIQSAAILGGYGLWAEGTGGKRPDKLSFFALGSDNAKKGGALLDNIKNANLDFSWIGQSRKQSLIIKRGTKDDLISMNGSLLGTSGNKDPDHETLVANEASSRFIIRGGIFTYAPIYPTISSIAKGIFVKRPEPLNNDTKMNPAK